MPLTAAMAAAERVRARIERECGAAVREVHGLQIAVSLGVEVLTSTTMTALKLIDHADQALYRAKRGGRNQVCAYRPKRSAAAGAASGDAASACLSPAAFAPAFDALRRDANARGLVLSGLKIAVDPYRALVVEHGQDAADKVVREVGQILMAAVRPQDLVVRLDAEHLGVVAPGLSIEHAMRLAETVRARVEQGAAAAGEGSQAAHRRTVSVGVDSLPASAPGAATLIERAGKALQRAKRGGGNLVNKFANDSAGAAPPAQDRPEVSESIGT
jgi:diguanylate cyclase (GGDEF)-like protein